MTHLKGSSTTYPTMYSNVSELNEIIMKYHCCQKHMFVQRSILCGMCCTFNNSALIKRFFWTLWACPWLMEILNDDCWTNLMLTDSLAFPDLKRYKKKFADMFKYSIIWSFIFWYFLIYFSLTLKTVTFKLSYVFLIIPLFWKIYHISLGLNKSVIGASKWNYKSRRIKISHNM